MRLSALPAPVGLRVIGVKETHCMRLYGVGK
jgi:hypothetical protein